MHLLKMAFLTILLCLFAALPALAQDYIYVVETDLALISGTDAAGLAGAHLQVVLIISPPEQVPVAATQAPTFYLTQYSQTQLTYQFSGTQGGVNDGSFVGAWGYWTYRNLHTDTSNDFIELSGSPLPLTGGPVNPALQIHFSNQNTPPTTPAPLFGYTVGDVDHLVGYFTIGNFPQVARYGFTGGVSYGGLDAVGVESSSWGAVKALYLR